MKKTIAFLLALFIVFISIAPMTYAVEERKTIRVGVFQSGEFGATDKSDKIFEYEYEYLVEISKRTGWKYEFISQKTDENGVSTALTFDDCIEMLLNDEIDILGSVTKTNEMSQELYFPDVSYGNNVNVLTVRSDNQTGRLDDPQALNGFVIGLCDVNSNRTQLEDYLKQSNVSDYELRFYESDELLHAALAKGEIDAVYTNRTGNDKNEKIIRYLHAEPIFFVTDIDNTELSSELNNAIMHIVVQQPEFASDLYEKIFSSSGASLFVMSSSEKEYVEENPVVKVSVNPFSLPIEYVDASTGEYCGIAADILSYVSDITGLQFEYVYSDGEDDTLAAVADGSIPLCAAFTNEYEWAEMHNIRLTAKTLDISVSSIVNAYSDEIEKIALISGYHLSSAVQSKHPDCEFIWYNTMEECAAAVNSGEADATYMPTYCADIYNNWKTLSLINTFSANDLDFELAIGVCNECDEHLFNIINNAVIAIPPEVINEAIYSNVLFTEHNDGILEIVYEYPVLFIAVGFVLFAFMVLVCFVFIRQHITVNRLENQKQINVFKNRFMSQVSREMRTPLNSIIGISSMAEAKSEDNPQLISLCKKIKTSGFELLQFVNNVLEIMQISDGKFCLDNGIFDPSHILFALRKTYRTLAEQKKITFNAVFPKEKLPVIIGDENHLRQALANLLSNAVKFTNEYGQIDFVVEIIEYSQDELKLRFSVSDSGCGITEEEIKHIYETFYREDVSNTTPTGGTGLGLPITKEIINLMGSELVVNSIAGKGSCFRFDVKFKVGSESTQLSESALTDEAADFNGMRFLVIEDNDLSCMILQNIIICANGDADIAKNGKDGCELFENSAEFYYDAVLTDIRMPVMDGYDTARYIRSLIRADSKIPIIAVSANSFADDIALSRDAGINAHMTKPVDASHLMSIIKREANR